MYRSSSIRKSSPAAYLTAGILLVLGLLVLGLLVLVAPDAVPSLAIPGDRPMSQVRPMTR